MCGADGSHLVAETHRSGCLSDHGVVGVTTPPFIIVIALRVRYALVQMQEGVRAAGEQRGLHPGRTGGLAAIAAVTALRLLVGVGRSRSCLPRRGHAGSCSSLLALRARCL